jgi:PAS domain S-box-containing protein
MEYMLIRWSMVYWSAAVLVGIALLIALHNVMLRQRVQNRTSLLEREIAERRLADYQLVASEQSLRAILFASPVGICSVKSGICQWANEAMAGITGYSVEELQGKTFRFLYKDQAEFERTEVALDEKGIAEAKWILKDGAVRDVSIRASSENADAHVLTVDDVTDRKEAEKRLRLSEQRFRVLFESAGDAIVILKDSLVVDCNKKTLILFDCTREQIVGQSILRFSPSVQPDGMSSGERIEEKAKASLLGAAQFFEWRYCRSGERFFDAEVSLSRHDTYGEAYLQAVIRDVTERKRLEDELKRLNTAMEQAAEAVIVTDTEGLIQYVNPAFEKTTGYSRYEVIGETPRILKSGVQDHSFYQELWRAIKGGDVWTGRITNKRKDGDLIQEDVVISPFLGSSGQLTGFIALKRNVTEEVRLENQLRHAQKVEVIGRLAGGVAHEFNGILTAIVGYASLLKLKMKSDDSCGPYVERILSATDKAAALTRSLLDFGRKRIINPKPLTVNDIVAGVQVLLTRLLSEDIELRMELSTESQTVMADAGQMDQVLMNLVTNARDAMEHGGVLTIRTGRSVIDDGFVRTQGFGQPGAYALISISDTGTGMDEETKEKIFEPFFTTKGVGEGTGLGLSMVYGIIRQHNGYIKVTSDLGKGTTFTIYLPLIMEMPGGNRAVASDLPRGTERILLAEDDEDLRKLLCTVLEEHGYTTVEAEDGLDAVEKALHHEIDMIVTDVVMPRMNGWEAYQRIVKRKPQVPTLFISGYTDDIIHRKGILDEDLNFLPKPITPAQLLAKVRSILDNRRP